MSRPAPKPTRATSWPRTSLPERARRSSASGMQALEDVAGLGEDARDLGVVDAQTAHGRREDALVGLVEDEVVDVGDAHARLGAELGDRGHDRVHTELEDAAALHREMRLGTRRLVVGRRSREAGNVQDLDGGLGRQAHGKRALPARAEHRRRRAVAEEHAGGAVRPVDEPADLLGRHHEHALGAAAGEVAVGDVQREDEARAGGRHVEGRAGGSEELRDGAGLRRHEVVAARGGADDEVELVRRHAGGLKRRTARCEREVVERLGGAEATLGDAGTLGDPLVRGVEKLGELVVGNGARRQRRPRAQNAKSHVAPPVLARARRLLTRQHLSRLAKLSMALPRVAERSHIATSPPYWQR